MRRCPRSTKTTIYTALSTIKNIIEYTSPDQGLNLFVEIENKGSKKTNIPISLKNDEVLLAKQTFDIDSAEVKSINFKIKESHIKGIVNIDYRDTYIFDNTFVFNKSESKKQNIAVIGLKNYFFDKLYPINSFNLKYYEEDVCLLVCFHVLRRITQK